MRMLILKAVHGTDLGCNTIMRWGSHGHKHCLLKKQLSLCAERQRKRVFGLRKILVKPGKMYKTEWSKAAFYLSHFWSSLTYSIISFTEWWCSNIAKKTTGSIFIICLKSSLLKFYLITLGKVRAGQWIALVIVSLVNCIPLVSGSITILILTLLD